MKKNWDKVKLGDLCEVITKGTTPTSIGFKFTDNGIKFIKVESLTESGKIIPNKVAYIDEDCHKALKRSQLKKDDILFSIAGALGRIGIVKEEVLPANTNQALAIIRLNIDSNALVEFMAKYFISNIVTDEIEKLRIGAAQQNLSLTQLKNLYVPLPPLPEQQRIVSILDRAFAAIDKAKANAEQNLQNAKELFESSLQGVFEKKGDGWEEKQLDEVCSIGDGNYSSKYPKASEFVKSGVPFLTATNLKNGTVLLEGIRFISKEQHSTLTKGHIIQGDLVIVVRGSSTGNNSIVPHSYEGSNLNSQLAFLRVKDRAYLDSDFLFAVFNSPQVMKKVKAKISGAAQPQLPNNKLLEISIHIPSLKEQQTIVSQLDALRSETQKLEAVYQKKMDDLEELKKSILQKAFAGDLPTRQAGLETEKVVAV